jgi:hypothetical protein
MARVEVKIGGGGEIGLGKSLPYAVLQLDNGIFHKKNDGKINFYIHLIGDSEEDLAT